MRAQNETIRLRRTALITAMLAAITVGLRAEDAPGLPPLGRVAKWSGLAASNVARWRGTRHETRNWNQPKFDASEWTQAIPVEGATFPASVMDVAGTHYPIPEQLQVAFHPFWLPRVSKARTGQNASAFDSDHAEPTPVWFREDFNFTEAYESCVTYVSQEVATTLYVNGARVGSGGGDGSHVQKGFEIRPYLRAGRNTLAIVARQSGPLANPLSVRTDVHEAYPVRTSASIAWLCSLSAGPGWSLSAYKPASRETWTKPVTTEFSPAFVRKGDVGSTPIWRAGDSTRQGVVYFRLPVEIAGLPNFGSCEIQADNGWELWVNGELAGVDKRDHMPDPTPVATVQIGRFLRPGKNVIGVKAYNYGGPGALAVLPRIKLSF